MASMARHTTVLGKALVEGKTQILSWPAGGSGSISSPSFLDLILEVVSRRQFVDRCAVSDLSECYLQELHATPFEMSSSDSVGCSRPLLAPENEALLL